MTTAEAIEIAVEAMQARKSRLNSEDRYYTDGEGNRHDTYVEKMARLDQAIQLVRSLQPARPVARV